MSGRTTCAHTELEHAKPAIGDRIRVRAAESERLSAAFSTEIAVRFRTR